MGGLSRALLTLPVIGAITVIGCASHPTDESLEEWFFSHKEELSELRDMLLEDATVQSVALETVNYWHDAPPHESLLPDRLERYRQLLRDAGIDGMGQGWGEHSAEVSVILSDTGLLTFTGASKWLVYTEREPAVIVDSLDTTPAARQEKFRHLEDNWYLMLIRNGS